MQSGNNYVEDFYRNLSHHQRDVQSLFGNEAVIYFPRTWDISDLAVAEGIFPSRSQAMKNGWKGPIPEGFREWKIKKSKKFFWTYKRMNFSLDTYKEWSVDLGERIKAFEER